MYFNFINPVGLYYIPFMKNTTPYEKCGKKKLNRQYVKEERSGRVPSRLTCEPMENARDIIRFAVGWGCWRKFLECILLKVICLHGSHLQYLPDHQEALPGLKPE